VLLLNAIGDQLIAWPVLRALDHLFPGKMRLLFGPGMYLFYRDVAFRETARVRWADMAKKRIDVERSRAAAGKADFFISLSTWSSPSLFELAKTTGAPRTLGYFEGFDLRAPYDEHGNMFDVLFEIPRALDPRLRFEDFAAPPKFSPAAERAALKWLAAHREKGEKLLFLHPETRPEKAWAHEGYAAVLEQFLSRHPEYKVLVSSRAPFPVLAEEHGRRIFPLAAHLELTLALAGHADLFLGIDSCFLHAADLYRIPGVALFGPTHPSEWGFRLSPIFRHVCGAGGAMSAIRPSEVLDALLEVAQSSTSARER
jgi:hypothetical protein